MKWFVKCPQVAVAVIVLGMTLPLASALAVVLVGMTPRVLVRHDPVLGMMTVLAAVLVLGLVLAILVLVLGLAVTVPLVHLVLGINQGEHQ